MADQLRKAIFLKNKAAVRAHCIRDPVLVLNEKQANQPSISRRSAIPQYDGAADTPDEQERSRNEEDSATTGQDTERATEPTQTKSSYDIQPFPPASSGPHTAPLTPHIGPADTDSVASDLSPRTQASRRGLNPMAPDWEGGAQAMLRRGQNRQTLVELVEEREPGVPMADEEQTRRRVNAAIYHLAMAYRYLSTADQDEIADRYDETFQADFGEQYEEEKVRAIRDEPNDPPSPRPDGEVGEDIEDDYEEY